MAAEEDLVFRINYQLEGVERSISTSRRALFTLNAIRLSIRDIQQVLSGPTIANVLFTAIQLTRTLTQARRLTKALAAEQSAAGVASILGAVGERRAVSAVGRVARGVTVGQAQLAFGPSGLFARVPSAAPRLLELPSGVVSERLSLLAAEQAAAAGFFSGIIASLSGVGAFALANPIGAGLAAGTLILGGATIAFKIRERKLRNEYIERNREIARTQGLEP